MSESAFTPGPWEWWTSNSWRRLSSAVRGHDQDGGVLCPVVARDGHPDLIVKRPDMALIAAAPDLYAALADLVHEIETDGGVDTSCWPILDASKAALAKARGE